MIQEIWYSMQLAQAHRRGKIWGKNCTKTWKYFENALFWMKGRSSLTCVCLFITAHCIDNNYRSTFKYWGIRNGTIGGLEFITIEAISANTQLLHWYGSGWWSARQIKRRNIGTIKYPAPQRRQRKQNAKEPDYTDEKENNCHIKATGKMPWKKAALQMKTCSGTLLLMLAASSIHLFLIRKITEWIAFILVDENKGKCRWRIHFKGSWLCGVRAEVANYLHVATWRRATVNNLITYYGRK